MDQIMAVNEQIWGNREDWVAIGSSVQWHNEDTNSFLNEYYPKFKRGTSGGIGTGRLCDYMNAGIFDREGIIDDSPAWVRTDVQFIPICFEGFHNDPTDPHYGDPTEWDKYNSLGIHNGETPIQFQTYDNSSTAGMSYLKSWDGYFVPSDLATLYPDFPKEIKLYQNYYRYGGEVRLTDYQTLYTVLVADQTARFALDYENDIHDKVEYQGEPDDKEFVLEVDTGNFYYIKDVTQLSSSNGYTYWFSLKSHSTYLNRPIISFCPKNFIMVIMVKTQLIWTDGYFTKDIPSGVPRPSVDGTKTLTEFLAALPSARTAVYEANQGISHPDDYELRLIVTSVYADLYNRDTGDTFSHNQVGGIQSNNHVFNVMFNTSISLIGSYGAGGEHIHYGYNQAVSSATTCKLPIFGTPGAGESGWLAQSVLISTAYDSHLVQDTSNRGYWYNNSESRPTSILFGMSNYYPQGTTGGGDTNHTFLMHHDGTATKLTTHVWWVNDGNESDFAEHCREAAAMYGLFFCDDYNALTYKNTPRVWIDPGMMCGTFEQQRDGRYTYGAYTSGVDNMDQPQFRMVDSEGHTWNPDTTFHTDNDYPQITSWDMIEFDEAPLPVNDVMTAQGNYPEYPYWQLVDMPTFPTPYSVFVAYGAYPHIPTWDEILIGAFAGVRNLGQVTIPQSVTSIGYTAFAKTAITSVTISQECEFYDESFPAGCNVKFYP